MDNGCWPHVRYVAVIVWEFEQIVWTALLVREGALDLWLQHVLCDLVSDIHAAQFLFTPTLLYEQLKQKKALKIEKSVPRLGNSKFSFKLYIHQNILKKVCHHGFHKNNKHYNYKQTIIINVSWVKNQYQNDFWRIMWHWRLKYYGC